MYRGLCILFFVMICTTVRVCAQVRPDTLQMAKQLRDKAKYKEASHLLAAYQEHYPKDINALWLHAQTEYWRHHFRLSQKLYARGLNMQPEKDLLRLDYAHSLLGMGDWKKADKVLHALERQDKAYSDQLLMRAQITYYQGDYIKAAKQVKMAIDSNTQSTAAKELAEDIAIAKAPWVKVGTSFSVDNQPMKIATPSVEAGIYMHQYSSLRMSFYNPIIVRNDVKSAQMVSVGDVSSFANIGLLLKGNIGLSVFPNERTATWTGDIYLQKTFIKYLIFDVLAEHKPYLYTSSSIDSTLSTGHITSSIGWSDQTYVNGRLGFDMQLMRGGNYIYTLYGYAYAPVIKISFMHLSLGYSYSYSDSRYNDYTSARPLDTIIRHFITTQGITGIYVPYFTPHAQQIHSALILLKLNPMRSLEIGASASIGFYAYTQNPYLYLDKSSTNEVYIARDYSRETFIPIDAGVYVEYRFAKNYSLKADYKYRSTYFYSSNAVGLSFKMSIRK